MNLIPMPKKVEKQDGFLKSKAVRLTTQITDERLIKAINKLPISEYGTTLEIFYEENSKESYSLKVEPENIKIIADSSAGVFYSIQTLRQLFDGDEVPCCYIEDEPDFEYRGFYHDITRGKVPKIETIKRLIDDMAYYKLNSLQLYVEHTFEFKEYADIIDRTGYLTAEEIKDLDEYCKMNFIDFVPSLAVFGHLYELLQQDRYKHLREIEDFVEKEVYWEDRMNHHTIDPTKDESFEIVKSLIDQYMINFSSDIFNICCDETFDLEKGKHSNEDTGKLYVDFVTKIINYLEGKGKTVMMWADIILNHPEYITSLPEKVELLNWDYWDKPDESKFKTIKDAKRAQIVCPGTNTWNRFCEDYEMEIINISKMAEYGYKYGAQGVLNTNWGDWGNPCSIELAMFGLVLGAEKSWNVSTEIDDEYNSRVNSLLYKNSIASGYIKRLSTAHRMINWCNFVKLYSNILCNDNYDVEFPSKDELTGVITECFNIICDVKNDNWEKERYKKQLILAAEGIAVMAELLSKHAGYEICRKTNTEEWLKRYHTSWLEDNKESEFKEIEKMFITLETRVK